VLDGWCSGNTAEYAAVTHDNQTTRRRNVGNGNLSGCIQFYMHVNISSAHILLRKFLQTLNKTEISTMFPYCLAQEPG
jgi:hypothetical protein